MADSVESPSSLSRVNSGVYDPASPSPHETPLLSPAQLEAAMEQKQSLPAETRISVAGQELSIFTYLVNLLQIDVLLRASKERPLPPWLEHVADSSGKYPLHWTVILPGFDSERVDLVDSLLDARADPNCRDSDTFGLYVAGAANKDLASKCGGKSPLHHLSFLHESPHSLKAVELLLNRRADLTLFDNDKNLAVDLAQVKQNLKTIAMLGGVPLTKAEAAEKLTSYEKMCTEREEAWERQKKEAKIAAREAYAQRLAAEYRPRYPALYSLSDHLEYFEPSFLNAVRLGTKEAFASIRDFKMLSSGLYQYRIFKEDVCQQLMDEVDNFNAFAAESGVEVTRPNSMNRYGLILNNIGFLHTMDKLMRDFIQPLARVYFADRLGDKIEFNSVHSFIVRYKMGEDLDLKTHADDSDLTLNVCLGKEFTGARLYFHKDGGPCGCDTGKSAEEVAEEFAYPHPATCRFCTFHYDHTPGVGLVHTGKHIHGVERLTYGERSNLIFWCRNRGYTEELAAELQETQTVDSRSSCALT